jgi:hypothetical protein
MLTAQSKIGTEDPNARTKRVAMGKALANHEDQT